MFMYCKNKNEMPSRGRDGLVCHLLLQESDVRGTRLAVTWVDVSPGSCQHPHRHLPEQVYVIVRGEGTMKVGEKYKTVKVGDVVYIPPNVVHGIENISDTEMLTYVTAATPSFDVAAMYDVGKQIPVSELDTG